MNAPAIARATLACLILWAVPRTSPGNEQGPGSAAVPPDESTTTVIPSLRQLSS